MKLNCAFEIALVDGGNWLDRLCKMHNTVMYTGYDLLAAMASSDKYINGMYLEFTKGVVADPTPISPTRDRAYYAALEAVGYVGDLGYCRIPLTLAPAYSTTGTDYLSNKATLVSVTDPVAAGTIAVQDGISQFFTVALVHIADIDDASQDKIYNVAVVKNGGVFAPILKPANVQIGITATMKFEKTP